MKCDYCKKEIGIAKSSSLYYNGNYYRGHEACMNILYYELEYPRPKAH